MLARKDRLRTNEINQVFLKGKLVHGPLLTLKYLPVQGNEKKYAFIVSKKTAKTAAARNSLRRKGYVAAYKLTQPLSHGVWSVFTIKKAGKEVTVTALSSEIAVLLKKTGL